MKQFITLALLATFVTLSVVDTAEARHCRRRNRCCGYQSACATNACHTGQAAYSQDPSMMQPYADPNMQYQNQNQQNFQQPPRPQQAPAPQPQRAGNAANDQSADINVDAEAELTN